MKDPGDDARPLGAADQDSHRKYNQPAKHDLEGSTQEPSVQIVGADPGDDPQFHEHDGDCHWYARGHQGPAWRP